MKKKPSFISREEGARLRGKAKLNPAYRICNNAELGSLASRKSPDKITEAQNILLEMKSLLKNKRMKNPRTFTLFDSQLFAMVTDALNLLK